MFLVRCVLYWCAMLWLVSRVPAVERTGIAWTVSTLQAAFGLLGQSIERLGNSLHTRGASVEIVSDCSPHLPFLIFAAVVLAFPAGWRQRALGILFGAVVIHLFNTIRIMTLIWILQWRQSWFEFAHVYLWQTGTILVVFVTFALWLRLQPSARKPA